MTQKKKQNSQQHKTVTEMMMAYRINNHENERSLGTARTNILDFRKFLKESNIPVCVARDIFCLQCWTGVRVSDVGKLLDSANIKEIEGITFSIFRPQKTKKSKNIRAVIPLTTPNRTLTPIERLSQSEEG